MFPQQRISLILLVVEEADLWWHGPSWLGSPELWPADVLNELSVCLKCPCDLKNKFLVFFGFQNYVI